MKTKTGMKRQGTTKKRRERLGHAAALAAISQSAVRTIPPRWRWHYHTLLALREQLLRDSDEKLREAAEPIETHSTHPADSATDEFEHDVALVILAREENALSDVNDAITRILDGRYGRCEASGVKIPARRLRALPWGRFSLEAEQQIERSTKNVKCRVPDAVSLRGQKSDLPDTGTITRGDSVGPAEEPRERDAAKRVKDESSPTIQDIDEPFDEARPSDTPER